MKKPILKRKKKKKTLYVWAIAYIHREHLSRAGYELEHYHYDESGIEAYIPTVRLIRKKFKGKNQFEMIPLLFNYGFFKIPLDKACDPNWLMEFKKRITCIYGWVKDTSSIKTINPRLNINNTGYHDAIKDMDMLTEEQLAAKLRAFVHCGIATNKEVQSMKDSAETISIFNEDDLKQITIGDFITLKGYPFDGLTAEVLEINSEKQYIKVNLGIDSIMREIQVSFENVIYTIYSGFDPDDNGKEKSIDELGKNQKRFMDKLQFNFNFGNNGDN